MGDRVNGLKPCDVWPWFNSDCDVGNICDILWKSIKAEGNVSQARHVHAIGFSSYQQLNSFGVGSIMRRKTKSERREAKRRKKRYGMRISGRSLKSVVLPLFKKRRK